MDDFDKEMAEKVKDYAMVMHQCLYLLVHQIILWLPAIAQAG